jgi:hypothetical protein
LAPTHPHPEAPNTGDVAQKAGEFRKKEDNKHCNLLYIFYAASTKNRPLDLARDAAEEKEV